MTTPDEGSAGDYGYDLAHEETARPQDEAAAPAQPPPGASPAHRAPDLDSDLAYDEAHDF